MNSGAKVRRFGRISVLNFSCRLDFFGTKVLFDRIIRTEQLSGGQSFLLRFERVAGGSAGIDLWSHSPLPQGQGRAECEL